jgi:hypothetical protein
MNNKYWQLRAASQNYYDAHRNATRLSNRIKALARQGLSEPMLDEQYNIAEDARQRIGKQLTQLYQQLAPAAIVKFQRDTVGLGEVYIAQLIGRVGDFITYTEAWWEETGEDGSQATSDSHGTSDGSQATSDSHSGSENGHRTGDSQSASADGSQSDDDSQTRPEKRVLVLGAELPCGVRDIWSYCGHGDAARRRMKGMSQDEAFAAGNVTAKAIIHMIADFAVRFNGKPDKNGRPRPMTPYYPYYLTWKDEAKAAHEKWTAGHCHNHALRRVAKAILKDIWRVQHGYEPVYGARTPWKPRAEAQPVG